MQFAQGTTVLIAIDNAESMDEDSWLLLRYLAEECAFVIMLSVSDNFKKPSIAASLLILKAHFSIRIKESVEDYFGPLLCWFLGVKAVHKEIFHYLKEKIGKSAQLLQEVLLSPTAEEFTTLVPFDSLGPEAEKNFIVSEFPVPPDQKSDTVLACDKKPEVKMRDIRLPTNINGSLATETCGHLGTSFRSTRSGSSKSRDLIKRSIEIHQQFADEEHPLFRVHLGRHPREVARRGALQAAQLLQRLLLLQSVGKVAFLELPRAPRTCRTLPQTQVSNQSVQIVHPLLHDKAATQKHAAGDSKRTGVPWSHLYLLQEQENRKRPDGACYG
ncbi:uncharacterized protein NPIL_576161 [Nephila pilipes]|uniref:Uncharacterized protein n=1 Tax=Nephila pilipes TaxID=299642 RepID=A0A8X6NGB6_NEPPI|nr:uncharacterized protein NPIL_576161 [Nephila pilipes]